MGEAGVEGEQGGAEAAERGSATRAPIWPLPSQHVVDLHRPRAGVLVQGYWCTSTAPLFRVPHHASVMAASASRTGATPASTVPSRRRQPVDQPALPEIRPD